MSFSPVRPQVGHQLEQLEVHARLWPSLLGVTSPSAETPGPYQSQLCWAAVAKTPPLRQSYGAQVLERQTPQR